MQASNELCNIITGWFDSVSKRDLSWADHHISRKDAVRLVGTDPSEVLTGEKVTEFLKEEVNAMGGVSRYRLGKLRHTKKDRSAGDWHALCLPCQMISKSRLAGVLSFTEKMKCGNWCNSMRLSAFQTNNC